MHVPARMRCMRRWGWRIGVSGVRERAARVLRGGRAIMPCRRAAVVGRGTYPPLSLYHSARRHPPIPRRTARRIPAPKNVSVRAVRSEHRGLARQGGSSSAHSGGDNRSHTPSQPQPSSNLMGTARHGSPPCPQEGGQSDGNRGWEHWSRGRRQSGACHMRCPAVPRPVPLSACACRMNRVHVCSCV